MDAFAGNCTPHPPDAFAVPVIEFEGHGFRASRIAATSESSRIIRLPMILQAPISRAIRRSRRGQQRSSLAMSSGECTAAIGIVTCPVYENTDSPQATAVASSGLEGELLRASSPSAYAQQRFAALPDSKIGIVHGDNEEDLDPPVVIDVFLSEELGEVAPQREGEVVRV
jgi:hypothetical protein